MKFANASKLDRKSGVRFGERGAPVQFPTGWFGVEGLGSRVVVSRVYWSVKGFRPGRPAQENCPVSSGLVLVSRVWDCVRWYPGFIGR
jgi:hypothetical protein